MLKSAEAVSKAYQSSVIWELVELDTMMVTDPGLTGKVKAVDDKAL